MDGDIEKLIDALSSSYQAEQLRLLAEDSES